LLRASAAQPDRTTTFKRRAAKHVCKIPHSKLCLRLDPDVCPPNNEFILEVFFAKWRICFDLEIDGLGKSGTKTCVMPDASTRLVWRLRHQHSESILAPPIRKAAQYLRVISMRHETSI
jgi:hypothetical protein